MGSFRIAQFDNRKMPVADTSCRSFMPALRLCRAGGEDAEGKDLSYTIVDEEDIPQALLDTIEEKKAAECKLTYETDDALYVVHGYGEQETGGYSIAVKEFYLTGNAVCIDTELIGPAGNEHPAKSPSFPYIVLKTERQNKNVVFE